MHQLEIKVLDIVDAQCNHEVYDGMYFVKNSLQVREPYFGYRIFDWVE